jgi:outer membrane protein, multidrug efflux system
VLSNSTKTRSTRHRNRAACSLLLLAAFCLPGCTKAPPTPEEFRKQNVEKDMKRHPACNVVFTGPLTLPAALAFAQRFNLQTTILERQEAIQRELATQSWFKMLPSLSAGYDFSSRSQYPASRSVNLETGKEALDYSYSQEKEKTTRNISVVWNVLDMGISCFMARQAEMEAQIARFELLRTRQKLALDVTNAYWDCAVATAAAEEAKGLIRDLEKRHEKLQKNIEDRTIPRSDGLSSRKEILLTLEKLRAFSRNAEKARAELKRLMGLSPDTKIEIARVDFPRVRAFEKFDVKELGMEALRNRPELFQEDLRERISVESVRIALARMLPSPSLSFRHDWDNTPHLHANYWQTAGVKASWSLLEIPRRLSEMTSAKMQAELVRERRMALAVGVLTQVHLGVIQYHDAAERCLTSSKIASVQGELKDVSERMAAQGATNEAKLISSQANELFARVRYMRDYADLKKTEAVIENSVGQMPRMATGGLPYKFATGEEKDPLAGYTPPPPKYGVNGTAYTSLPPLKRERHPPVPGARAQPVETAAAAPAEDEKGEEDAAPAAE